jgi:hypothetical protein
MEGFEFLNEVGRRIDEFEKDKKDYIIVKAAEAIVNDMYKYYRHSTEIDAFVSLLSYEFDRYGGEGK